MRLQLTLPEYQTLVRIERRGSCEVERSAHGELVFADGDGKELDPAIVQHLAALGFVSYDPWRFSQPSRLFRVLSRIFSTPRDTPLVATRAGHAAAAIAQVPSRFDSMAEMLELLGERPSETWECMRQAGGCGRIWLRTPADDCCGSPAVMRARVYADPGIGIWKELDNSPRLPQVGGARSNGSR